MKCFRSSKLANYSLFENPKLLPKIYLLSEIQTFSFPRIVRYHRYMFRKNHKKMKHASDSIENNVNFVNNYIYFY